MGRLCNKTLVFLLLLVVAPMSAAQFGHSPMTVTGIVLSEEHAHIPQAVVRLADSGGNLIEQTTTTESGEFSFRSLQRDHYILFIEANGFQSVELHVDLSYASDKGITVYMKPLKVENTPASLAPTVSAHDLSMPSNARELVGSGRKKVYVDRKPDDGIKDFQHALAIAPDYYEVYFEIAMAYITMSKKDEAEANFRKSIDVSHDTFGDANVGLGILLVENGEVDRGEKALRRGVQQNPNSWLGFYELGKLDFNRGHLNFALDWAEKATTLAPNTPIIYRLLSNIHMGQKNYKALLDDLDAYIKLDPNSPAGLRAAELRNQVAKEVAKQNQTTAARFH